MKGRLSWHRAEDVLNLRAQQQVAIAALGQAAISEDLAVVIDLACRFVRKCWRWSFAACSSCDRTAH